MENQELVQPTTEEFTKIVAQLFSEFIQEERDNKVTRNNMSALLQNVIQAQMGNITLQAPEGK